jgi:GT2 family glycosyltransferase
MKVSLIIPTYNRGEVLANTIDMALAQDYPDYEVIVVDQSTSPSVNANQYARYGDRIRFLTLPRPSMPGARNAGVMAAHGEIVIFIDDDVVFGSDFVAGHVRGYDDPSVGGVTGLTCPARCTNDEEVMAEMCTLYALKAIPPAGTADVEWVVGCNSSYRRSLLLEAGLYDERFKSQCDDSDISVRVRQSGHRLLLDTRFRLIHLELKSGGARNRDPRWNERELDHMQSSLYFFIKHRHFIGFRQVVKESWWIYRKYGLNSRILRHGARAALKRQFAYVAAVARAFFWSATPARPAATDIVPDPSCRREAPINAA